MKIKIANLSHAKQIRAIYAPFVTEGFVTFETQIPGIEEFEHRIIGYTRKFPWLVMMEGDTVLGYAHASAYRERVAYQWVVECSVYTHSDHRKKELPGNCMRPYLSCCKYRAFIKFMLLLRCPIPKAWDFMKKQAFGGSPLTKIQAINQDAGAL